MPGDVSPHEERATRRDIRVTWKPLRVSPRGVFCFQGRFLGVVGMVFPFGSTPGSRARREEIARDQEGRAPRGTGFEGIMDVLDQITELARRVADTHGLDLVDVELSRAGRRRMLRIYVGKAAGVSVDDCARVSREVSAVLDAENWLGDDNYVIEVSSPGLDRPFKTLADWQRNVGRDVKVTCREKVDGKIMYAGKLVSADEAEVVLEGASGPVKIPMALV